MTAGGTRQEMPVDDFAVRTSKQRPGRLECTDEEYKKSTPNCFSPASAKLKLEGKFSIARGIDNRVIGQSLRQNIAVLEDRLYLSRSQPPASMSQDMSSFTSQGMHYFTMDSTMRYMPFCADFGPFNMGMTHHFCQVLRDLLASPRYQRTKLVYYTSPAANDTTNAIFLLGSFLVLYLGATPEDAWAPFTSLDGAVKPYRDATWVPSPYDLHVKDCWAGLAKAVATRLYDPTTFDEEEYFYYDHPSNGDLHEVVKGKFFAFKGPSAKHKALGFGRFTLTPQDYSDVFRAKNIRTVVRLNDKEYNRNTFVQAGFNHYDLFFTDCSTPSDAIVDMFLRIAEEQEGALAVHCLAGLGRTGTLIAMYMMKHMYFTANECIAWLRIMRPGSVIGPQQQYLKDQEDRMWALGRRGGVLGLGLGGSQASSSSSSSPTHIHGSPKSPKSNISQSQSQSQELADQITNGMHIRDQGRYQNGVVSVQPAPHTQGAGASPPWATQASQRPTRMPIAAPNSGQATSVRMNSGGQSTPRQAVGRNSDRDVCGNLMITTRPVVRSGSYGNLSDYVPGPDMGGGSYGGGVNRDTLLHIRSGDVSR